VLTYWLVLAESRHKKKQPRAGQPVRRTAAPEERRQQLIDATIRCVANRGLAETTIATVAKEAGLSQGIINLHFQSKDRLLTETLRFIADEFRNVQGAAAIAAEQSPAKGLEVMVEVCFRRDICSREKLALWFAFWGERKFRPTYRRICAARDKEHDELVRTLCTNMATQNAYRDVEPVLVANGFSALIDGLWLDLLVRPETMNREMALRIMRAYLADAFPRHFQQPAAGRSS